jgi:hypothetical protein
VARLGRALNPYGHFSEAFEQINGQIQLFITAEVHEKTQVVTMYACESALTCNVSLNNHERTLTFLFYPCDKNPLAPVWILVLCHQKFVTEFRVYLPIFKPPFPADWESA